MSSERLEIEISVLLNHRNLTNKIFEEMNLLFYLTYNYNYTKKILKLPRSINLIILVFNCPERLEIEISVEHYYTTEI